MTAEPYRIHIKKTFLIAYPVMLSHFGQILVGVADSVMVGQLGTVPLAAVSLANSIFVLILMFGIGISLAMTPLVAAAAGEHNRPRYGIIFKNSFVVNICAGILLSLLIISVTPLLYHLNQPEQVVDLAIPYLLIIVFSLLPFMFFQTFKQYAEGLSFTRNAMFITLSANLLNIILNYLLIHGKAGFPELGLNGAGWATFISRVLMAIAMAVYVYRSPWFMKQYVTIRNLSRPMISKLLHIGIPTGMQYVFEVGAFSVAAIMMGWISAQALAAHQIAINLAAISYMLAAGIGAAATVRVGNELGKRDIFNMRRAGFSALLMSVALMSCSALIFIVGRYFLPSLYIDETSVIDLAASLLVIAAFFQLSDGLQVTGLGSLRGMADVKIPTIITLFAYWVVGLPVGYWLGFGLNFGPQGVWYGLLIGLSMAAVLLAFRFNSISLRLRKKKMEVKETLTH